MNIQDIIQIAKENLLKNKSHPPTFLVERRGIVKPKMDIVILDYLADGTPAQKLQIFNVARGFAQQYRWNAKDIIEIAYIAESWVIARKPDDDPNERPSQAADRKEMLYVSLLTTRPRTINGQLIEILRDGSGDLVDLLQYTPIEPCEHVLLAAFLAGVMSRDYSDAQLTAMAKQ